MPSQRQAAADDAGTGPLWFTSPGGDDAPLLCPGRAEPGAGAGPAGRR